MIDIPIWLLALLIVASIPAAAVALCLAIMLLFELADLILEKFCHDA